MKSRILFLLFLIYCCYSTAQISNADKKQLLKVIGKDFILLPNQKTYPYCGYSDSFKVDMSNSLLNDTVGVSFHNEHLIWHDLISFCGKEEVLKLAKPSYVTVEEYLEFQNWVRDSIAREKLYLNNAGRTSGYLNREWTGDQANKWINYQDSYYDEKKKEYVKFDLDHRALGRKLFNLNWDTRLEYDSPDLLPLLADMYYPQPERLYKKREFDERKLYYRYNQIYSIEQNYEKDSLFLSYPFTKYSDANKSHIRPIDFCTATLCDTYSWAQCAMIERDEYSVLGHTYTKLATNSPIIGINGPQAKAFCHWKQEQLQMELIKRELPYTIILTLPGKEDQMKVLKQEAKFIINENDYTVQWRITNSEYDLFVEKVKDSILREKLFCYSHTNEDALKFINYSDYYFDENTFEYIKILPNDLSWFIKYINDDFEYFKQFMRSTSTLNESVKLNSLNKKTQKLINAIKKTDQYTNPIFRYEYIDSREKSVIGNFGIQCSHHGQTHECTDRTLYLANPPNTITHDPNGRDLILSYTNILQESSSVRSHENFQRLIIYDTAQVIPTQKSQLNHPDSLIQNITYEQAIAFYYWKYPIHNPNPKDDWQKFVLPSKEQFEAVQSGKQVIVPEKKVAYPTPLFRYVVHVYPK